MDYKLLNKLFYQDKDAYTLTYNRRFNSVVTRKYDFSVYDNEAFSIIDDEVLSLISDIYKLDKKLSVLLAYLPEAAVQSYTKKSLLDEVFLTNEMEGVFSTRRELEYILDNLKQTKKERFHGLVNKYFMLLHDDIILQSCDDIRQIYDELCLKEVVESNSKNKPDGKIFRKDGVEVTDGTKAIHMGISPESKIIEYIDKALRVLGDDSYNELINISVFHYMFGYIHPFYDGNGRMSRFISSYMLSKALNPLVGYKISYTIKENINEYYRAFKICNDKLNKGDLTPFIIIFLEIIKKSLENLIVALTEGKEKTEYYLQRINVIAKSDKEKALLEQFVYNELFGDDGLNVEQIKSKISVGESTIRKLLSNNSLLLKQYKIGKTVYYNINLEALDC